MNDDCEDQNNDGNIKLIFTKESFYFFCSRIVTPFSHDRFGKAFRA